MTKSKHKTATGTETDSLGRLVNALERIATSLEIIVDRKKKTLRMVDVERGQVYKTHLGRKLSSSK